MWKIPLLLLTINLGTASIAIQPQDSSGGSDSISDRVSVNRLLQSPISPFDNHGKRGLNDECECFNCKLDQYNCINYGECQAGTGLCSCPIGFGGPDCAKPLCGSLADGSHRPARPDPTSEEEYPKCACAEGWGGVNCNVCLADSVCSSIVEPAGVPSVCYKDAIPVNHMYLACGVENRALKALLGDKKADVTFTCLTGSDKDEGFCQFEFWVNHRESFACHMNDCDFTHEYVNGVNRTEGACKKVQCSCIPGRFICGEGDSLDITELLEAVEGPSTFRCKAPGYDGGRYNCEFDEKILRENLGPLLGSNPVIELDCTSGECMREDQVPDVIPTTRKPHYSMIFSIIGGSLVLSIAAGLGAYVFIVRYKRSQLYQAVGAQSGVDDEMFRLMDTGHHIPATVSFRNIGYQISRKGDRKRLLRGIYGVVKPGEVMAIMGASGAGKTTCLDILAGRAKRGVVSGQLLINGMVPTRQQFKKISGYVDQEDTLLGTLTVYETLLYSALLRLPKDMSHAAKVRRVQDTMVELGIEHIANSRIGYPGHRGISGGEKRRVSIAMEVVTSPSVIYLDEPTSGLDSYNALTVVQSLVRLAKNYNRTVILSIHQPRSNIFAMFDKLLLLAEGGFMVYSGPIFGRSSRSVTPAADVGGSSTNPSEPDGDFIHEDHLLQKWMESIGVGCPVGFHLADYLIDMTKVSRTESMSLQKSTSVASTPDDSDIPWKNRSEKANSVNMTLVPEFLPRDCHIQLDSRDANELESRPHLIKLVYGFLQSSLCLQLKNELESFEVPQSETETLAPTVNAESPSIVSPGARPDGMLFANVPADNEPFLNYSQHRRNSDSFLGEHPPDYDEIAFADTVRYKFSEVFESVFPFSCSQDKSRPSFYTQLRILSGRSLTNVYRNPVLMLSHYMLSIILALALGVLFWQVKNDIAGFQSRLGFFFFVYLVFGLICLSSLELFTKERTLFVRERSNGYYGAGPYFLSKIFFDIIPLRVIPSLLLGSISYYMVGLTPDAAAFFKFLGALTMFNMTSAAQCFVIGVAMGHNLALANLISVLVILFSMLFGGFLINMDHMSPIFSWMQYLSNYRFAFEAVIVNEASELILKDVKYGAVISLPGSMVLESFGFR
eukprot:Partr_v1_DN28639_c1_g1_i1_m50047 putative (ABC) transporter